MCGIVLLALVMTVIIQNAQLRRGSLREQQLRAALADAETKAAWVEALDEWNRFGNSPSLNKRWADGMQRGYNSLARP
jgi:hypothetical protein